MIRQTLKSQKDTNISKCETVGVAMARKRGAIIRSRNKVVIREEIIKCSYCGAVYTDETEDDYYFYLTTKINYCRECQEEFVNGITENILYKYS